MNTSDPKKDPTLSLSARDVYTELSRLRTAGERIQWLSNYIASVQSEIERLKRGEFTDSEFQSLCHNFQDADVERFADGCVDYMNNLFGRCPLVKSNGS